jgi:hypothetical protein
MKVYIEKEICHGAVVSNYTKIVFNIIEKNATPDYYMGLFGHSQDNEAIIKFIDNDNFDATYILEDSDVDAVQNAKKVYSIAYEKHQKNILHGIKEFIPENVEELSFARDVLLNFRTQLFILANKNGKTEVTESNEALIEHAVQLV